MIADEDMVITVTHSGYVKRTPLSLYRAQQRGGKGRTGMTTKDDDFVEHLFVASAHSYILVFTESGRVHWLKVHEIPQAGPGGQGQGDRQPAATSSPSEKLATTVAVREFPDDRFLVFATAQRHGQEDRALGLRQPARRRHHRASTSTTGDRLLAVRVTDGEQRRPARHRARASPSASRRATCGRWAAPPTACAASRLREGDRVVGDGGARRRRATSSPSPSAATASARRSTSTASRAAAARASSTSR